VTRNYYSDGNAI